MTRPHRQVGARQIPVGVIVAALVLVMCEVQAAFAQAQPHDSATFWATIVVWAGALGIVLCGASDSIKVGWCRRAQGVAALFAAGGPHLGQLARSQPTTFVDQAEMPTTVTLGSFDNSCRGMGIARIAVGLIGAAILAFVAPLIPTVLSAYAARQSIPLDEVAMHRFLGLALLLVLEVLTLFIAWWGVRSAWNNARLVREVRFAASERLLVRWSGRMRHARQPLLRWATAQARFLGGAALGVLVLAVVSGLAARQLALSLLVGAAVVVGGGILLWLLGVGQSEAGGSPSPTDASGSGRKSRSHANLAAVAWADIDAFCILERRRGMLGGNHTIFGVHAASTFVTWEISSRASATQQAAHERLCRLIVTRTGLPLRDLTASTPGTFAATPGSQA